MSTTTLPPVTLIVVNWNALAHLPACLPALLAQTYPHFHIVLVDNASTDNSLAWVRQHTPQVEIIESTSNVGFSAGNNLALRRCQTPFVVLVNPDTIAPPDWLTNLITPLLADDTIGIAGSRVFYPDGTLQHAGGLMTMPQALPHYWGVYQPHPQPDQPLQDVDYVIGASLAIRQEVMERVGLLDEGYFMYFEEADWCKRVRQTGYRVVYVPASTITHVESGTTAKGDQTYFERFHTSRWRYLLKHLSLEQLLTETMPAEEVWLPKKGQSECWALLHAYGQTIAHLPRILSARDVPLDREAQYQLLPALLQLRAQTWTHLSPQLPDLQNNWAIAEPTLTSTLPLVGRWVAWFRNQWLNVSARWYIRLLWQQQNHFNQIAGNQIYSIQQRITMLDQDQIHLSHTIADVQAEWEKVVTDDPVKPS